MKNTGILSKSIIGIGLAVTLVTVIGGSVYLADKKEPETVNAAPTKDTQLEEYVLTTYKTYVEEIVPQWNSFTELDESEINEQIEVWETLLAEQPVEYEEITSQISEQVIAMDDFLELTQQEITSEQRRSLRNISHAFAERHEEIRESLFKVLDKNGVAHTIADDGSLQLDFTK